MPSWSSASTALLNKKAEAQNLGNLFNGGRYRDRTDDPFRLNEVLSR